MEFTSSKLCHFTSLNCGSRVGKGATFMCCHVSKFAAPHVCTFSLINNWNHKTPNIHLLEPLTLFWMCLTDCSNSHACFLHNLQSHRFACLMALCLFIYRLKNNSDKRAPPPALRAALKTRLLLEKWRVRQHHRARAWEGESVAS